MGKFDDSVQVMAVQLFDALSAVNSQLEAGLPVDRTAVQAALARAVAPMAEPVRISIDNAIQAGKLTDTYGQHHQQRAMRLQMADPRPQTASGLWT